MSQHPAQDAIMQHILASMPEMLAEQEQDQLDEQDKLLQQALAAQEQGPTRDLGGTDDLLDMLSAMFSGGQSQQGLIAQGNQDFPGLDPFPARASAQHLATAEKLAPLGQTAGGIGGGLIESLENALQGTNDPNRPLAQEDTALDFLANLIGTQVGQSDNPDALREGGVTTMNALSRAMQQGNLDPVALQDSIAPFAGPMSRGEAPINSILGLLMNGDSFDPFAGDVAAQPFEPGPKPLSAIGGGVESLIETLSQLFGVQGSRAGQAPTRTQTATSPRG